MRWDALSLDGQEPGLFGQPVTVDTPEFRGITFHEIRAKSIINTRCSSQAGPAAAVTVASGGPARQRRRARVGQQRHRGNPA